MKFKIITRDEQNEILSTEPKRLPFGHFFPSKAQAGVGARMILDSYSLGYVNGRVSWMGSDKELDQKTADKCRDIHLADKLYKFIKDNGITTSSDAIIFGEINGYKCLATPNASYGYVYMSFWPVCSGEDDVNFITAENVQVGQIFSYSWGYEQTNVSFYVLDKITKSRKTGTFRKIEAIKTSDGPQTMTGKSIPDIGNYMDGEQPFKKRLNEYEGELFVRMDYGSLRVWNGKPKRYSTYG
jgi:hypothetical protein